MVTRVREWLWGKGGFFDMGDRYPLLDENNESSIPGMFVIGDVAGTPDIKAALNTGYDVAHHLAARYKTLVEHVDAAVAILGAGPAGVNAANELRKLGVSYIVFERKEIFAAIKAFEDDLPLFYPSTGEPGIRGDLPYQETTAQELMDVWMPLVESLHLNIHEREEVKAVKKKGAFVITTNQREYLCSAVLVATGKLTFLKKLGVEEEYDPRVVYEISEKREYAGKHILVNGTTAPAIHAALRLAKANTVTVLDHHHWHAAPTDKHNPAFVDAVNNKRITFYDDVELHQLETREAVLLRREGDVHHEIRIPNDLVMPFTGVVKAMVSHRDMPREMLRGLGMKFENTWDWKRYTWLVLALIGSAIFYYEKKTAYAPIGFGAMAGVVAGVVGGFYFLRGILNGIDELRYGAVKKRSVSELIIGGIVCIAGWWAWTNHPVDIWPRSLGSWYPALYSALVTVFGFKAIMRWRDSIQTKKILALIFFQVFFFWILPEFIIRNWLSYTLVYAWPLVFAPHTIRAYLDPAQDGGLFYFWWAIILTIGIMPVFVAATGKKYCSWVCGCGGLAETVGDSFRQFSPKGKKNIERERSLFWVTGVALVLTIVIGVMTLFDIRMNIAGVSVQEALEKAYVWGVDWALVSFIPIALYPFFGGKIWCRYWCPTALYMHVLSKWLTKKRLGYFKIDAKEDRCIACDMCSRYCEVGIDVMKFALKGKSIDNINSSCIGCGVCISVCPTDVLTFGESKSGQLVQITLS